jgi:hypothetical protein
MLLGIALAPVLAPLLQTPRVEKLNGPILRSVSAFTWTPDGAHVAYGADRSSLGVDDVTIVRLADRSEAVWYSPYAGMLGVSASASGFDFPPDPGVVAFRYFVYNGSNFPPSTADLMFFVERSTALQVATPIGGATSYVEFLDDGRMLYKTSTYFYRQGYLERGWIGRWDSPSSPIEISPLSPPPQPNNYVSRILAALQAGVAVFGWRDHTFLSNAQLFSVPLGGGALVALTPPPPVGQRDSVDVVHVRSSDELVIYAADEDVSVRSQYWAVPIDGSLAPRLLNPPIAQAGQIGGCWVSPDETRLVFRADIDGSGVFELWSTDIDGGASVRLSGPMVAEGDVYGFWLSPDGERVVYLADQAVDQVYELFSAPIDGQAPAVRLHAPLSASDDALMTPHFTPDGQSVVFAVQTTLGRTLFSGATDGSSPPLALNSPFPQGGGVHATAGFPVSDIAYTVAIAPGARGVFFLGEQDVDGVVELYRVPIDGRASPRKWSASLVAGGNVTSFAVSPKPGAVLYRADQEVDERFELFLSRLYVATPLPRPTGSTTPP